MQKSQERENKQSFLIGRGVSLAASVSSTKVLAQNNLTTALKWPATAEIHSQMDSFKATLPKLSIWFLWKNISALACRGSVKKCFQANSEYHITVSREQEFNLISNKRTKEGWIKSFDDELCAGFLWWNVGDSWDERSGVERCHDASDYGGGEASLVQLLFPIWWGNEILAMSLLSFYSNAFQHNSPAWCENTSILTKSKQKSAQRNKNLIWFISHLKLILSALKHQFLPSELCDFILYLDYLQTVVCDENCS